MYFSELSPATCILIGHSCAYTSETSFSTPAEVSLIGLFCACSLVLPCMTTVGHMIFSVIVVSFLSTAHGLCSVDWFVSNGKFMWNRDMDNMFQCSQWRCLFTAGLIAFMYLVIRHSIWMEEQRDLLGDGQPQELFPLESIRMSLLFCAWLVFYSHYTFILTLLLCFSSIATEVILVIPVKLLGHLHQALYYIPVSTPAALIYLYGRCSVSSTQTTWKLFLFACMCTIPHSSPGNRATETRLDFRHSCWCKEVRITWTPPAPSCEQEVFNQNYHMWWKLSQSNSRTATHQPAEKKDACSQNRSTQRQQ